MAIGKLIDDIHVNRPIASFVTKFNYNSDY